MFVLLLYGLLLAVKQSAPMGIIKLTLNLRSRLLKITILRGYVNPRLILMLDNNHK